MSESHSEAPEQPSRETPHIRLNSGQYEVLSDDNEIPPVAPEPPVAPVPPVAPEPPEPNNRPLTPRSLESKSTTGPSPFPTVYASFNQHGSTEFLIPPRPHRHRDDTLGSPSSNLSIVSSRRTSWSSEAGSYDTRGYSRAQSRAESDEIDVNTQTVTEKYNIMPTDGLLLFPEDVEKDDYMHNPDPSDREGECDIWNRRGVVNLGALVLLTIGLLVLFIGYPVVTAVKGFEKARPAHCEADDLLCLEVGDRPLLSNIRRGLIDPDTPESVHTKKSADGKEWKLVFSDEFNTPGRTFYDEDDPYYQAVDIWYGVTQDLEWYDPDAVTTKDGVLEIRFDSFPTHEEKYRSGMIQSWNKLCFSGGRLEASISLPGDGEVSGFWPGFWAMGNLGRPGYAASTEGMWPYSYYDECDAGITPNQSSVDGISWLPGMRLPACTCPGSDHPTPGRSRSAPEIDVIEASVATLSGGEKIVGSVSQSLQMAPFDIWYMPDYDYAAVYDQNITQMNTYRGGPYQQAMSGVSNLNNNWYNGNEYQVYAFEYTPGPDGDITWFIGPEQTWTLDSQAIGPNGNIGQRVIPLEPLAIVMNLGMAWSFAPIDDVIEKYMPATMRFDYIRIYQDPDDISVTCDPVGFETTEYIADHPVAYQNINKTTWSEAGYDWPMNSFMHEC
ncbi:beta-glucan synthesis-associated protein-domain-containing protein [Aspergillus cavernicola]|uniref:Beta-glucan synthesis-associated protein-domain-containing protein n=1 Tax=Aspergillus cavernicola TaxID=176166 RepID=A0ABR4J1P0_9EURO